MKKPVRNILPAAAISCVVACGESPPSPPPSPGTPTVNTWFADETETCGIDFTHVSGDDGNYYLPQIMSGGVLMFDAESDGDLDLLFLQGNSLTAPDPSVTNQFFVNDGIGNFRNATDSSGLAHAGYAMGGATGDFDGDGLVDLYVTNVGRDVLYRNRGNGQFEDVTDAAGVATLGFGSGATFFDFDRDGDLDLFAARYIDWSPERELECRNDRSQRDYCDPLRYDAPMTDMLYRNDDGVFTDVSESAGFGVRPGNGLGVSATDFNGDGWLDLFVANDRMPDHLWLNQGDGTFVESAMLLGCAVDDSGKAKAGMGVAAADLDDDGDSDLLVGNLVRERDSLFVNESDGDRRWFRDTTARAGIAARSSNNTRWGLAFRDFNHDGILDLFQANGRVLHAARRDREDEPYAEPNLLLQGLLDQRFAPIDTTDGLVIPAIEVSHGAAFGDLNGDGLEDIVVVNKDARPTVMINTHVMNDDRTWRFDLRTSHGAPAIGAVLTVTAQHTDGKRREISRVVHTDGSYAAASDPRITIAPRSNETLTAATIIWPDGIVQAVDVVHGVTVVQRDAK